MLTNLSKRSLGSIGKPHPKTQFTSKEDQQLMSLVQIYGDNNWEVIAQLMEGRNVRQCRERYTKYLSPDINRDPWSREEDNLLIEKHNQFGPKWVKISKFFNKRTDAAIKNRWNILLRQLPIRPDSPSSEPEPEQHENELEIATPEIISEKDQLFYVFERFAQNFYMCEENAFDSW